MILHHLVNTNNMGKSEIEALTRRIEALECKVGRQSHGQQPVIPYLVDYSNDLGNSLAGNDRIGPLLKRLDELETYLDPLYGELKIFLFFCQPIRAQYIFV